MSKPSITSALIASIATVAAACTGVARADFTVDQTRTSISPTLDRINLFVTNTGGASGVNTVAMDISAYGLSGTIGRTARTLWHLDPEDNGLPTIGGFFGSDVASGLHLSSGNDFIVYKTPGTWGTGDTALMRDWQIALVPLPASNNGTHFKFASLVVEKDAGMHLDIMLAGSIGSKYVVTQDIAPVNSAPLPLISGVGTVQAGTSGTNSFFVTASSASSSSVSLALVGDPQNALGSGASIVTSNGGLRVNFSPSAVAGTFYNLDFRATDADTGLSTVKTLSMQVVNGLAPEPTSLAAVLGGMVVAVRRSRR